MTMVGDQRLKRLKTLGSISTSVAPRRSLLRALEEKLAAWTLGGTSGARVGYLGFSILVCMESRRSIRSRIPMGGEIYSRPGELNAAWCAMWNAEIFPMMRQYGIRPQVCRRPLAGARLYGKYTSETLGNLRNRYYGFDVTPFDKDHGLDLVDTGPAKIAQDPRASAHKLR